MSDAKVSPTRINLLAKKRELILAKRGHKLLKDKRDGLMREFMSRVRLVQALRVEVNLHFVEALKTYVTASAVMPPYVINNAFRNHPTASSYSFSISERRIMSVVIPEFFVHAPETKSLIPYGYVETLGNLDGALQKFYTIYPQLIKLAELESTLERLAEEIERTRRRASALEHIRIPLLNSTIRMIYLRLEEQARDAVVNTMRVKKLINSKT